MWKLYHPELAQSSSEQVVKVRKEFSRIFYMYAGMMVVVLIGWVIYERRKHTDRQRYNQVE